MKGRRTYPGRLPLGLALLVVEGYLYVVLVLAVFLGALAVLAWGLVARRPLVAISSLLVGPPLLATTSAAIRALWFPIPEPAGIGIAAGDAPTLHALVETLRRQVGAPKVDSILVVEGLTASAVQSRRWAIFGTRHTLLIGFPMLALLSQAQLRALIAHELAHFSRTDAHFARWVYRTRVSWLRLVHALHQRRTVPIFVHWLFRMYVPRLQARSSAISREQEFRADRVSADVAGAQAVADTLMMIEAGMRFLEEGFWPGLFARRGLQDAAPRPFHEMRGELRRASWDGTLKRLLRGVPESTADPDDTHPALRDRLAALGMPNRFPTVSDDTAGRGLLGAQFDVLTKRLDARWLVRHGSAWSEFRDAKHRLVELEALVSPGAAEMFERARLVEELRSADEALPLYLAAGAADPPGARAAVAAGRILLDDHDPDGTTLIEQAMRADAALVPEGCALLAHFHRERGHAPEAHRYEQQARRHATQSRMAQAERDTLAASDNFAPPGVDTRRMDELATFLGHQPDVAEAFLTDKLLRYSPGRQRVLAVLPRRKAIVGLAERMEARGLLPPETRVVLLASARGPLLAVLRSIPEARIYPPVGIHD